jgi:hypothetical protein
MVNLNKDTSPFDGEEFIQDWENGLENTTLYEDYEELG